MDRSTSKHGPRLDEEMKKEVEGQLRAGHPTRAEEWHDPEPIEDENSPDVQEEIEQRRERERGRTENKPPEPPARSASEAGEDR
jgi:hypothetical protein